MTVVTEAPLGVGPIEHGHMVRCTIDGIGTLEHGVVREGQANSGG